MMWLEESSREILLVVEDNKDIREYIATSFADKYDVRQANDGREGLAIARRYSGHHNQ